jgi:hypothetical protein
MNRVVPAFKMLTQIMDLSMTVMARCNAVPGSGLLDLLELEAAVMSAFFRKSRLKEAAPAAATEVVGHIGGHIHKILFSHHRSHHEPKILGDGITQCFSYNLARILDGEFDVSVFIPVG